MFYQEIIDRKVEFVKIEGSHVLIGWKLETLLLFMYRCS